LSLAIAEALAEAEERGRVKGLEEAADLFGNESCDAHESGGLCISTRIRALAGAREDGK
jgi:hypothetical protein